MKFLHPKFEMEYLCKYDLMNEEIEDAQVKGSYFTKQV